LKVLIQASETQLKSSRYTNAHLPIVYALRVSDISQNMFQTQIHIFLSGNINRLTTFLFYFLHLMYTNKTFVY